MEVEVKCPNCGIDLTLEVDSTDDVEYCPFCGGEIKLEEESDCSAEEFARKHGFELIDLDDDEEDHVMTKMVTHTAPVKKSKKGKTVINGFEIIEDDDDEEDHIMTKTIKHKPTTSRVSSDGKFHWSKGDFAGDSCELFSKGLFKKDSIVVKNGGKIFFKSSNGKLEPYLANQVKAVSNDSNVLSIDFTDKYGKTVTREIEYGKKDAKLADAIVDILLKNGISYK